MDKNTVYILNDLLDAVEELAGLVRELNPGATKQHGWVDFLLARADRQIKESDAVLERS